MYHTVERTAKESDPMGLAVPEDIFIMQMEYLKRNGFNVISLAELSENEKRDFPERSVAITFDDGYKGVFSSALPVLKRFAFTATLFVSVDFIERKLPPDLYWSGWPTLTWDDIRELKKEGISIGSHSVTHGRLDLMTGEAREKEVTGSKEIIGKKTGDTVDFFSYPHGSFNREVKEAVKKAGYRLAASSVEGINGADTDPFAVPRTEITAFDNTERKFELKLSGCYDWLRGLRKR